MSEKRRALGRGLGALIPSTPPGDNGSRPVDVFFKDNSAGRAQPSVFGPVTRERRLRLGRGFTGNGRAASDVAGRTTTAPMFHGKRTRCARRRRRTTTAPMFHGKPWRTRPRLATSDAAAARERAAGIRKRDGAQRRPRRAGDVGPARPTFHGKRHGRGASFPRRRLDRVGPARRRCRHGIRSRISIPRRRDAGTGGDAHPWQPPPRDGPVRSARLASCLTVRTPTVRPARRQRADASGRERRERRRRGRRRERPGAGAGAWFAELPVLSIRPNPRQPRTVFDDDDMAELAHSIAEIGVLQPVVVRPIPADELADVVAQPGGSGRSTS